MTVSEKVGLVTAIGLCDLSGVNVMVYTKNLNTSSAARRWAYVRLVFAGIRAAR
jgi:hypothetical protein